jgi:AcrR family transcriptional regulator
VTEAAQPSNRRDRPPKSRLSQAAITAAALELVERDGLNAVSLRKVADQLNTGPASLYSYVADRDELLHRMLDQVLSEVAITTVEPREWQLLLVDLFTRMLNALARYPGLAQVALGSVPAWPGALAICEHTLALLRCGGTDAQTAARVTDALFLFTVATAVEHAARAMPLDQLRSADRFAFALNAIIKGAQH